ncbi:MAG: hypothetical protein WDN03_01005 [Rhizomicrobium sp.]
MALDRSVRLLSALSGASTSRVLNLAAIAAANANNPAHRARPMFTSSIVNASILLKHRVRSDETYLFGDDRQVATKIIVPFDARDMRAGGRSLFVDQRGFQDCLREIGHYGGADVARDIAVLRVLNSLPSLDPFLLREHLRSHRIECADCYFEISRADQQRMYDFVTGEIGRLIQLATGHAQGEDGSTGRLVSAMLSSEINERLEPLRLTLGMSAGEFREGVFSWRGFLYYKWCMERLWPEIVAVLREARTVRPVGAIDGETRTFLADSQRAIVEEVRDGGRAVRRILGVYDAAYDDLVRNDAPRTFRDFLMSAPRLFLELGEKTGAISHIVSFWRYRFPARSRLAVDSAELVNIFQDFRASFSAVPQARKAQAGGAWAS